MTWVEPTFICGECGGQIARWPMLNLLKQEILDWRHKTVPEGVTEHRAVLGTKAHQPRIVDKIPEVVEAGPPEPAPPPEMPARPALHDDLPGPAASLDKSAEANGWAVQAWIMRGTLMDARWKPTRVVTSVVLHLDRDGERLIATWRTKGDDSTAEWDFDGAWRRGHVLEPLGGNELKAAVKYPRTRCDTCGEPVSLHVSTNSGLVCFTEWVAIQAAPDQGGST